MVSAVFRRQNQEATMKFLKTLRLSFLVFGVSFSSYGQLQPSEASAIEAAWASGQRLANAAVSLKRGFDPKAPFENNTTDANGIARSSTKYWERIEIHVPRILDVDHMACLMVHSKCIPLPIGTTFDNRKGILFWHVPNAYKGDFDFVFLQPGSRVVVFRVT